MKWQCGSFELDLSERPLLMGILNVTPDSFSDGYPDPQNALAQARKLAAGGADIIDVGGESTRPGSASVALAEELARVIPVIRALRAELSLPISIDTQKPAVAEAAVEAGANIINHVSGSLDFADMADVLVRCDVGYVGMHMLDRPKTMQRNPDYDDVVDDVTRGLLNIKAGLSAKGVGAERMLFDPGIGFGKTLEHNLELLRNLDQIAAKLERPLLMGVSRKSWMTHLLGVDPQNLAERDAHTALASVLMPHPAAAVHRVHHVSLLRDAFKLARAAFGVPTKKKINK